MSENLNKKRKILIAPFLILMFASFVLGVYVTERKYTISGSDSQGLIKTVQSSLNMSNKDLEGKNSENVDFGLYWELWNTLKEEYVDKDQISEKDMFYGSLMGMAMSLDDPYTVFMTPSDSDLFEGDLEGTFSGIGAEVGIRDDVITVIAPLNGMPAEKAGLKAGDKVLAIDGEPTIGMRIEEAVMKIRGEEGTVVTLTIYRKDEDKNMEIEITRGIIYVESVNYKMRDDGIYLIEINNFNTDTADLFSKAVYDVVDKKPKGIIVDLRNNPGGFLDTSIDLVSQWIEEGVVVKEVFSDGKEESYFARDKALLKDYPTVVLVNGGSASASEIMAGALQDYDKAEIVGDQTYGKGSVQVWKSFADGSSAKITTAKWLTPNGTSINDNGITPDVLVEYTVEDFKAGLDPQLDKAVEIILAN